MNTKNMQHKYSGPITKQPSFLITSGTSVWRNRRFVRWWDMAIAFTSTMFSLVAVMLVGVVLAMVYTTLGLSKSVALHDHPWILGVLAAMFYFVTYVFFLVPAQITTENAYAKQRLAKHASGLDDSQVPIDDATHSQRQIAESFLLAFSQRDSDLSQAVYIYKARHAKAGVEDRQASLIIEEGRTKKWAGPNPPTLEALVLGALKEVSLGEEEPLVLPVRPRFVGILMPILVTYIVLIAPISPLIAHIITDSPASALSGINMWEVATLGVGVSATLLIWYFGFREMGFFLLALWRGECSVVSTRVLHRFSWRTFVPGRDLAIVRYTSNRDADIAFIGANGEHATARAGGRSLEHFIACWSLGGVRAVQQREVEEEKE